MQDYVVRELQQIGGVGLAEPQGAFYCLPVMTTFFGPSASAPGFGSIPDADTLCRLALGQIEPHIKLQKIIDNNTRPGLK